MNLTDWIKNPNDINAGRELYKEYGNDPAIYKVLCVRDSTGLKKVLFAELSKVAALKFSYENEKLKFQVDSITELSPELKELESYRIKLYKKTEHLKFELNTCDKKERRCELAHAILDNFDEINAIWAKIDFFKKNKRMPDPEPDPEEITETDPIKLVRMLTNLRSNISKYKNKPDLADKLKLALKQKSIIEEKLYGAKVDNGTKKG